LAPEAGALWVGNYDPTDPDATGIQWWANDETAVTERACLFDDEYVFHADGTFENVMDGETWLEAWQGVDSDQCGSPVAPHDGSNAATWEVDAATGSVTLTGLGAYLGLPKVVNAGELPGVDVPETRTYTFSFVGDAMHVVMEYGENGGSFWAFKFVDATPAPAIAGTWKLAPEAGAMWVGPHNPTVDPAGFGGQWWANDAASVTARACYFDDEYVFHADGTFENVMDEETWLEAWQGDGVEEGCGAPIAPHDGSNAATWGFDAATGSVTLTGLGAYLGLPKVVNAGELPGVDIPETRSYNITLEEDIAHVIIEYGDGGGNFWYFKMIQSEPAVVSHDPFGDTFHSFRDFWPEETEGVWDWSAYDSLTFSYNIVSPASLPDRMQFRLNINDYGDVQDPANYDGPGEYWYSFWLFLDDQPGWNTVSIALDGVVDANQAQDGQFHMTGWVAGPGNGEFDKDAIGGMHFEFSIGGGGDSDPSDGVDDSDWVSGTILFDDFRLTGSLNQLTNPGFELPDAQDDGMGWGSAVGSGYTTVVTDAVMAHSGENYLNIGIDAGSWSVYYTEDAIPAQFGETWRFTGFGKQVSGDYVEGGGAAFKLEAKDASGTITGTTGDVFLPVSEEWGHYSVDFVMPEGTETVTAVIVAAGSPNAVGYAFDDMLLMSMGVLDVIPPVAVEDVISYPGQTNDGTSLFYNFINWTDVPGEEGETYNVYASVSPIEDIMDPSVDVVAVDVLEGSNGAIHYLYYPLEDTDVTYYYAVVCKDASNNVGLPGSSATPITNGAKGVPTVSLSPPSSFAADGDLTEWYDSGIQPFILGVNDNSYGTPHMGSGSVDNDNDLNGTFWLAIDNDYLYLAAEILDDVVTDDGSGGWWTADVVQMCIGLYDQRGPKHIGMERGLEPDYKMYFNPDGAHSDNGGGMLAEHGDGNYYHEVFNPDYVFEFRISLDDILLEDDSRLMPANGMRIPFEPMIHDNDGNGLEGIMVLSKDNNDNAHQTCEVWSNTWIGNQATMVSTDEDILVNEFALHQNYPNPFNPQTTIKFSLPEAQRVNLSVYNMLGQQVLTLVDKELPAGYHTAKWYAGNIASGVYIYRLTSNGKSLTQKMLLMK